MKADYFLSRIPGLVQEFAGTRVLVLGDSMLDQYTRGVVPRMSPEAPVPVFHTTTVSHVLGGAANVAHNVSTLGAETRLVTLVGNDAAFGNLSSLLDSAGIGRSSLFVDTDRPTTLKNRIVDDRGQQLMRFDYESTAPLSDILERQIIDSLSENIAWSDVIIFSDYAKGFFTQRIVSETIAIARSLGKLVVADIKPANKALFAGVDLITPNRREAQEMTGIDDVAHAAQSLADVFSSSVCITCGADGMVLYDGSGAVTHIPATHSDPVDVTGAGDTVVAVIALALQKGCSLSESAQLANIAGGLVVRKSGTATLSPAEFG
ncbi:MAG: bifunctional ADP-heptose synthase [Patescibacteria group bacterium]